MSAFYDLASLVLVPSGYKAQKVYAQKPLTTDGQLTFSRASTATRVNSAGLIETVSSNVPRLDYTNSTCPKLLLEPSRTNSLRNSQNFGAWTVQGAATRTTGITDPGGGTTAATISNISTTGDFSDGIRLDNNAVTINANDTLCFSVYLKGSGTIGLALERAVSGTYFFVTTMVTLTADWKRHTFTTTVANAASGFQAYVCNKTGSTATSFSIAFGQVEIGAYPTSYIPTTTAAVTRLADACSKTGISSLIGQTEGTIFVEFNHDISVTAVQDTRVQLSDGSFSNWIFMGVPDGGAKTIRGYINGPGGSLSFYSSTNVVSGKNKAAFAYKSGSFALYLNGALVGSNTTIVSLPACSRLDLTGNVPSTASYEKLNVNQALLFKTRLTNAQLAELTAL